MDDLLCILQGEERYIYLCHPAIFPGTSQLLFQIFDILQCVESSGKHPQTVGCRVVFLVKDVFVMGQEGNQKICGSYENVIFFPERSVWPCLRECQTLGIFLETKSPVAGPKPELAIKRSQAPRANGGIVWRHFNQPVRASPTQCPNLDNAANGRVLKCHYRVCFRFSNSL
ncbi:hypothetical protein CEXT_354841 [Caerostris extrusa]|uniref:Uncharacterized protein n=1 Tax=Caerostris extrusa TaxID=172846 RepID=A0AAV4URL5_CAEEX|nr:hypothetical protein CEXT_354841 [Caerostris extrusa]